MLHLLVCVLPLMGCVIILIWITELAARLFHVALVPIHSLVVEYVMWQPLGMKLNTVVKMNLGRIFQEILWSTAFTDAFLGVKCSTYFIAHIYAYNSLLLIDIGALLRGRCYNPWRKRIDRISLETDQIILSVILFSLSLVMFSNIFIYYFYFVFAFSIAEFISMIHLEIMRSINYHKHTCSNTFSMLLIFKNVEIFLINAFTGNLFVKIEGINLIASSK